MAAVQNENQTSTRQRTLRPKLGANSVCRATCSCPHCVRVRNSRTAKTSQLRLFRKATNYRATHASAQDGGRLRPPSDALIQKHASSHPRSKTNAARRYNSSPLLDGEFCLALRGRLRGWLRFRPHARHRDEDALEGVRRLVERQPDDHEGRDKGPSDADEDPH